MFLLTRRFRPYLPVECVNVDRTVGLQAGKKSAFKSSIVIDTLPPSSQLGVLPLTLAGRRYWRL